MFTGRLRSEIPTALVRMAATCSLILITGATHSHLLIVVIIIIIYMLYLCAFIRGLWAVH